MCTVQVQLGRESTFASLRQENGQRTRRMV